MNLLTVERLLNDGLARITRHISDNRLRWLWLIPAFLIFIPFFILPAIAIFVVSLFTGRSTNLEFTGLNNYQTLLSDSIFHTALINTFVFTGAYAVLTVGGGLLLALGINNSYNKFQSGFQVLLLVPYAILPVGVGIIWTFLTNPRQGVFNSILDLVGIQNQPLWLGDPSLALYVLIIATAWYKIGFFSVIWLVGLKSLNETYIEAAQMDGASSWEILRYIKLPLLKPIGLFLLIISVLSGLRTFGLVWISTRGGPGTSTEVLMTYLFQVAFSEGQYGYGATIGIVLFVLSLIASVAMLKYFGTID